MISSVVHSHIWEAFTCKSKTVTVQPNSWQQGVGTALGMYAMSTNKTMICHWPMTLYHK